MVGARASTRCDLDAFNRGDHVGALAEQARGRSDLQVLYPSDATPGRPGIAAAPGIFLRLGLAAGSRAPPPQAVRRHLRTLADHAAIQLNDTHPAIAVAELMRLLVDRTSRRGTRPGTSRRRTFSYTNHTLLPEALETWPVPLMERVLPRHMQIIYLINARISTTRGDKRPSSRHRVATSR